MLDLVRSIDREMASASAAVGGARVEHPDRAAQVSVGDGFSFGPLLPDLEYANSVSCGGDGVAGIVELPDEVVGVECVVGGVTAAQRFAVAADARSGLLLDLSEVLFGVVQPFSGAGNRPTGGTSWRARVRCRVGAVLGCGTCRAWAAMVAAELSAWRWGAVAVVALTRWRSAAASSPLQPLTCGLLFVVTADGVVEMLAGLVQARVEPVGDPAPRGEGRSGLGWLGGGEGASLGGGG